MTPRVCTLSLDRGSLLRHSVSRTIMALSSVLLAMGQVVIQCHRRGSLSQGQAVVE